MRRTTTTALRPQALRPSSYVCRSCLASSSPPAGRPPTPPGRRHFSSAGYAPLPSRRLIALSGPDAARYLQGVITANVNGADGRPRDRGFYTAFLNAQGRLLHDVFIYPDVGLTAGPGGGRRQPDGESFLIEVDAAEAERLQKHIKRYKLRAKFSVRLLDGDELSVWQAWDDAAGPGLDAAAGDGGILLRDPRAPGLGHRLVTPGGRAPALGLDPDPAGEEAYHIRRYLRGVPEGQSELERERALPHESNLDLIGGGAVDFHKGCYVGQELTIRTQHRGVVRKRVLPCALYAPGRPAPDRLAYRPAVGALAGEGAGAAERLDAGAIPEGQSIGRAGKKGRSAGRWLKGIGNVGLALCRLEIMTGVPLPGEAAPESYSAEAEFVIDQKAGEDGPPGQAVRVKAFVPDWLRAGIEQGR